MIDLDAESQRLLELTDEEVMAEHVALYEGNETLAKKAISMLRAKIETLLAQGTKH